MRHTCRPWEQNITMIPCNYFSRSSEINVSEPEGKIRAVGKKVSMLHLIKKNSIWAGSIHFSHSLNDFSRPGLIFVWKQNKTHQEEGLLMQDYRLIRLGAGVFYPSSSFLVATAPLTSDFWNAKVIIVLFNLGYRTLQIHQSNHGPLSFLLSKASTE